MRLPSIQQIDARIQELVESTWYVEDEPIPLDDSGMPIIEPDLDDEDEDVQEDPTEPPEPPELSVPPSDPFS